MITSAVGGDQGRLVAAGDERRDVAQLDPAAAGRRWVL
jgi:hypothetical protein